MSILTKLFPTVKSAEKIIDGVRNGIDKMTFTAEERAGANTKIADALAEYAKETLTENSIRSYTRRYLCVSVVAVYLLFLIASVALYRFDPDYSKYIYDVADECLSTLVLMTFGFYVGAYMVKSYLTPKELKWQLKNKPKKL